MKAAVLHGRESLAIQEVETPNCDVGEVLIRVKSCGICKTDVKCYMKGQYDLQLPRILGHEITGVIEAVGEGVEDFKKGDRVQVFPGIPCGECEFCKQGMDNLCDDIKIMGFNYDGGFAEYVLVPRQGVENGILNPIPEGITFEEASMAEPLGCSVNMQEKLEVGPGNSVIIFGAGRLGILNGKLAKSRGAANVILVETNDNRLSMARTYEFDYLLNPTRQEVQQEIMRITGGRGADVVIPCCPGYDAMDLSLRVLAKKGRLGFFSGLVAEEGDGPLPLNLIHYKEITVLGSYGCTLGSTKEAMRLISDGSIKVKDMITHRIVLEEVEEALKMVRDLKGLSICLNY